MTTGDTNVISFGEFWFALLVLGLFYLAYHIDRENKEYCVQGGGSVHVYDRDVIFDDWSCN